MKRCFLSSKSAVLKQDFQDVHSKNLLGLRWLFGKYNSLNNYVDITLPFHMSREIFQFFSIFHRSTGGFLYVRNSLHSCIYLSFFLIIILRSCDCKFVFCFWAQGRCCICKYHCSKEKGTVTKAKSLFVGGLEIFPKNYLHRENSQTNYLYSNKSLQKICWSSFKALSICKFSASLFTIQLNPINKQS